MRRYLSHISLIFMSSFLFGYSHDLFAMDEIPDAKNVILIIGDGMDDQQITIARNYLKGAKGQLILDQMPLRSASQVLSVSNENPAQTVYVADSANSASAIATGVVTSRGRIATTAKEDLDAKTIVELASDAGFGTGIVTTASVTDATPASFVSHVSSRNCENPGMMKDAMLHDRVVVDCRSDLKANGGKGSIAEQIATSDVDIILGGGLKHFDMSTEEGDLAVITVAEQAGFHVIDQLSDSIVEKIPTNQRVLGLFSEHTMPVMLRAQGGKDAEKPSPSFLNRIHKYLGSVDLPAPMNCELNPEFSSVPTLKGMTDFALSRLSNDQGRGFFLMIESASIDKQAHQRKTCGHIGEVGQLEEALQSALAFAEENPSTLVIVTADHGQSAQLIPNESLFSEFNVPVFTPGHLARIKTPEGSIMAVNYATNTFVAEEHSGVNVPLFSNTVGLGLIPSMVRQPQLFEIILNHLGLKI